MIYRPGCRYREPAVVQSNPATRHADNLFALDMLPSLNTIPGMRYPVDLQCHNCDHTLPDWTALVNHVCRRTT
jgi:hypothetical protein